MRLRAVPRVAVPVVAAPISGAGAATTTAPISGTAATTVAPAPAPSAPVSTSAKPATAAAPVTAAPVSTTNAVVKPNEKPVSDVTTTSSNAELGSKDSLKPKKPGLITRIKSVLKSKKDSKEPSGPPSNGKVASPPGKEKTASPAGSTKAPSSKKT